MSRSNNNYERNARVVQEAMHYGQDDGILSRRFNANNGKWEDTSTSGSGRQELSFDPKTGKLVVTTALNTDSVIAIPMAASGFWM